MVVLLVAACSLIVVIELAVQHRRLMVPGIHVLHFVVPVTFIAVGLRLMQVYAQALGAAEAGAIRSKPRVAEITAEIERNFAQLAELRVEQVTAAGAQAHRRRPARRPRREAADHRAHQRERAHLDARARGARRDAPVGARPDRQAGAADRRARRLARRGGVAPRPGRHRGRVDAARPRNCRRPLPARAYVQTTRILREAVSNIIKHSGASHCTVTRRDQARRFRADDPGQRQRHPDGARRPARPRPRHGEHEAPRQAVAGPVPGRIGPGLRNRDPSHASALIACPRWRSAGAR